MTAKILDFQTAAQERGKLSLKKQTELLLELTAAGSYPEALELGEQLVLRLLEAGDDRNAKSLAVTGLPLLRQRIRYGR